MNNPKTVISTFVIRDAWMKGLVFGLPGLFSFLLSWGNFPLSLFTTGADSTLPEWLYAKMVSGYSPLVPSVGILSIITSIILLFSAITIMRIFRTSAETSHIT